MHSSTLLIATLASAALLCAAPARASLTTGALTLDANFHTISVRAAFSSADSAAGNDAIVEYRRVGEAAWRQAAQVWIDVRPTLAYADAPNWARNEARTKIFGVAPNMTYEVRVTFSGSASGVNPLTGSVTTRDDNPPAPALRTLYVSLDGNDGNDGLSPSTPKRTLGAAFAVATAGDRIWIAPGTYVQTTSATLAASGSPSAWIRVTRWPGLDGEVVLEGGGTNENVLFLQGSYVRVDGLTIRRALGACIRIEEETTDHWIDGNVITDWNADESYPEENQAGVAAWSNASRLVIADNLIARRASLAGLQHGGGNGIWVKNQSPRGTGGGHHVIRGNTIIGGYDGIGSEVENDARGGYYQNTDIYENVVSEAQDDCIQIEGADVNCAVFANTVYRGLIGIAFAPNGVGPLFVMRNQHLGPTWSGEGALYKTGDETDARTWIFHESGYEPDPGGANLADAIEQTNPGFSNFVTRNNAWHVDRYVVETTSPTAGGAAPSMDYDALFTTDSSGRFVKWFSLLRPSLAAFQASDGQEPHGMQRDLAALDWVSAEDGTLQLRPGSMLIDAGVVLPGINSNLEDPAWNFEDTGPDIGAFEAGGPLHLAPTTEVTSPLDGETVGGTVEVAADASDDGVVERVELRIDGTLLGVDTTAPYSFVWQTAGSPDGVHVLQTRAIDDAGNVGHSAQVGVGVDNGSGGVHNSYLRFKAKLAPDAPRFTPREVSVSDQFGPVRLSVQKPASADDPAALQPGAIVAPQAYLTCYKVKRASGEPRFERRDVKLSSAVGVQRWSLRGDAELCSATARDGGVPASGRDDFRCYKAKTAAGEAKFVKRDVPLVHELGFLSLSLRKPVALCTPADSAGDGLGDPAARLACYAAKPTASWFADPRSVNGTDEFGPSQLLAIKPVVVCLAASELPLP